MADSQNDSSHSQPDPKNESGTSEDEISLISYFTVLWKRRYFIVFGTALPTLVVGLALYFLPCDYKVTYSYDLGLDEKDCKVLVDQFYGAENGQVLAAGLKDAGFDEYSIAALAAGIKLEVSGTFLVMTVTGSSPEEVRKISSVARNNIEGVLPIYSVKARLGGKIAEFKARMADIEENEFDLKLELERKKAILAKLKNLEPVESREVSDNIILQFEDLRTNSEFLPIAYQVQVTDANIVNIEETIADNRRKSEYYNTLQSLNERLLDELNTNAVQSLSAFHSSLVNVLSENEGADASGYLKAYIKKIESVMGTMRPVVLKPGIHLVSRNAGRKTATIGAVLLMVTILAAFLLESLPQKHA